MKYCSKCGQELADDAIACSKCGCTLENTQMENSENNNGQSGTNQPFQSNNSFVSKIKDDKVLSICAIVFAVVFAPVGLGLGIYGLKKFKDSKNRILYLIATILSAVIIAIYFFYKVLFIGIFSAADSYVDDYDWDELMYIFSSKIF